MSYFSNAATLQFCEKIIKFYVILFHWDHILTGFVSFEITVKNHGKNVHETKFAKKWVRKMGFWTEFLRFCYRRCALLSLRNEMMSTHLNCFAHKKFGDFAPVTVKIYFFSWFRGPFFSDACIHVGFYRMINIKVSGTIYTFSGLRYRFQNDFWTFTSICSVS